jgi:serine/threonine protein phosphatase 1
MKRFVVGDIHGANKALLQVLERCKFNNDTDQLISLGDVVDGWPESYEVVETLLSIKNLIAIRGNHDEIFLNYLKTGVDEFGGSHGSKYTHQSYKNAGGVPNEHVNFFELQLSYFKDHQNNCFVHGGFNRHYEIHNQSDIVYSWDRDLFLQALSAAKINSNEFNLRFKENVNRVFIGHTPTINWNGADNKPIDTPIFADRVINLDTGAAFTGKLTIMDVDTLEYWQSDIVRELYPFDYGRNKTTFK